MIIGIDDITGYSDFAQVANCFLTVRFTVNVRLSIDGTTDTINFYMWADSGTPQARGGIYKFNPATLNSDKIILSPKAAIDTTPQWRSRILPSAILEPGNVYHFGMICEASYNMKFLNPDPLGDSYKTQSMETGTTIDTLPATILESEYTKYPVSSAIYITGTALDSGKKTTGIATIQGISTMQL